MEALLSFVIAVIIICVIAGIVLWAVQRFFPEIYPPESD
jgi:Co/Zn/Cd efflux system component